MVRCGQLKELSAGRACIEDCGRLPVSSLMSSIASAYRASASITFSFIVLIVLFNLGLGGLYFVHDSLLEGDSPIDPRVQAGRERYVDLQAYSRLSAAEANAFLDEQDVFGSKGFLYAPWVQFRAPEIQGRWLNTDSHGFRRTKAPRSSTHTPLKVFVFGGSTTFGYGVPDDYTIPSYLQAIMEEEDLPRGVLVSNYGQGYYYSSQEMQLFLGLIKKQIIPDYAIFIDGLNDTGLRTHDRGLEYDAPWFTPEIRNLWDAKRGASTGRRASEGKAAWGHELKVEPTLLSRIPMVRFARGLSARFFSRSISSLPDQPDSDHPSPSVFSDDADSTAQEIVSIYTANVTILQAVCQTYRVKCSFIWQPVPFYRYDPKLLYHPPKQFKPHWEKVYSKMKTFHPDNFLYLGDILEGVSEKAYVDQVHYNERANELIARKIYDFLQLNYTHVQPRSAKPSVPE